MEETVEAENEKNEPENDAGDERHFPIVTSPWDLARAGLTRTGGEGTGMGTEI